MLACKQPNKVVLAAEAMLLQAAVQLSEGQENMILQFRRATLTKLGAIIKQRAQLLQLQAEVLATLRAEGVSAKDVRHRPCEGSHPPGSGDLLLVHGKAHCHRT